MPCLCGALHTQDPNHHSRSWCHSPITELITQAQPHPGAATITTLVGRSLVLPQGSPCVGSNKPWGQSAG